RQAPRPRGWRWRSWDREDDLAELLRRFQALERLPDLRERIDAVDHRMEAVGAVQFQEAGEIERAAYHGAEDARLLREQLADIDRWHAARRCAEGDDPPARLDGGDAAGEGRLPDAFEHHVHALALRRLQDRRQPVPRRVI